jgi:hypothetical protein
MIQLVFDKSATQPEREAVERAFIEAGLRAEALVELVESRSIEMLPWVIYVTVPTATAFFVGFVGQAGADAWKGLRGLIDKVFLARKSTKAPPGTVVVRLSDVREAVVFKEGLPDAAFRQIVEFEIVHTSSGQLNWDTKTQTWHDPLG